MEEQKPKSIKTIGKVVSILAGYSIITTGLGMIAWLAIDMEEELTTAVIESGIPLLFLFKYYIKICLIIIAIDIIYLIGGIYVRKYKLWANQLLTGLSIGVILATWGLAIAMFLLMWQHEEVKFFIYIIIVNAFVWSIPFGLLIRFLNMKKIKKHFIK